MKRPATAPVRTKPRPYRAHANTSELKRSRILASIVEAVAEVGYARVTVAHIVDRAHVSRSTFYDLFADRETCFMDAFEQALADMRARATVAYEQESIWSEGVRSALASVLSFMDEDPMLARAFFVETLSARGRPLDRRREVLDELARVVDRGRMHTLPSSELSHVTADAVVGGVAAIVCERLLAPDDEPLRTLLGPLMSLIVLPYLGVRVANRELKRPPPPPPPVDRGVNSRRDDNPLRGLNIRLTYRTVRVLTCIGECPGASNRQVAEGSGIVDQGQISKLLSRLASLELIENRGEGWDNGAPNAWSLTHRGTLVVRATQARMVA